MRGKGRKLTFALVALFAETPKELLTEGAERGLAEELGHELVAVDFVRPAREEPCSRVGFLWVLNRRRQFRNVPLMFDRTAPFGNVPGFGFLY